MLYAGEGMLMCRLGGRGVLGVALLSCSPKGCWSFIRLRVRVEESISLGLLPTLGFLLSFSLSSFWVSHNLPPSPVLLPPCSSLLLFSLIPFWVYDNAPRLIAPRGIVGAELLVCCVADARVHKGTKGVRKKDELCWWGTGAVLGVTNPPRLVAPRGIACVSHCGEEVASCVEDFALGDFGGDAVEDAVFGGEVNIEGDTVAAADCEEVRLREVGELVSSNEAEVFVKLGYDVIPLCAAEDVGCEVERCGSWGEQGVCLVEGVLCVLDLGVCEEHDVLLSSVGESV